MRTPSAEARQLLWERRKPRYQAATRPIAAYAAPTVTLGSLLLVVVLLGGCQRTLFETAPAAAGGCEALVGHWQSLDEGGGPDGEIDAAVADDCTLRLVEHGAEGTREYPPLALQLATQPARWIWVDAAEANAALAVQAGPVDRSGSVYAFAWSLDGDVLALTPPAHRALAHRVLDGELDGAVHAENRSITVRVDGDRQAIAALLAADGSMDARDAIRFRRTPVAP